MALNKTISKSRNRNNNPTNSDSKVSCTCVLFYCRTYFLYDKDTKKPHVQVFLRYYSREKPLILSIVKTRRWNKLNIQTPRV